VVERAQVAGRTLEPPWSRARKLPGARPSRCNRVRGANEQGGEADAGSSHGACTLEEHVAAVQEQCTAMEQFMRQLRELDATHQQRTADLHRAVSCFASVLQEAVGNAATSYVAREVPACPRESTDLGALCAYVCHMLEFIATLGCTSAGASPVEQVRRAMKQASALSAQLPCAMDKHATQFAVACVFAVVHQTEVPVDEMMAKALAADDAVEACDGVHLESLMRSCRAPADAPADRYAALAASYHEEALPDPAGFARLGIRREAWSALEGDSVQGLISLLVRLEQAHATVSAELTHVAQVCDAETQFAPHGPQKLTYAHLHGTFLKVAQAGVALEHERWAATVRHATAVQGAARRTMLIWQSASIEPGLPPAHCDQQNCFDFVERNIPKCCADHHRTAVCDLLARYARCCVRSSVFTYVCQ